MNKRREGIFYEEILRIIYIYIYIAMVMNYCGSPQYQTLERDTNGNEIHITYQPGYTAIGRPKLTSNCVGLIC